MVSSIRRSCIMTLHLCWQNIRLPQQLKECVISVLSHWLYSITLRKCILLTPGISSTNIFSFFSSVRGQSSWQWTFKSYHVPTILLSLYCTVYGVLCFHNNVWRIVLWKLGRREWVVCFSKLFENLLQKENYHETITSSVRCIV